MAQATTVMAPHGGFAGDLTSHMLEFRVSSLTIATLGHPQILVNGYLEPCNGTTADEIVGVASETITGNTLSAKCAVYTDPNMTFINDTDGTLSFAHVGRSYRVLVNTGQIDQSTGTAVSNQAFILVKVDPFEENDFSAGVFKINRSYWTNHAKA